MWLLDANMDIHLPGVLTELGIRCDAATRLGWRDVSNRELVSAAAEVGFTCLLTRDRMFAESAGRTLQLASVCIVVVHIPQKPWREFVQEFRAACAKQPIVPAPGAVIHWPPEQA
jgi:predicted nuclease of predicted toxin-antitoxin system